jgi:site-specific DNA recombinase
MIRAAIYNRVSTGAQEQEGTSLETQERAALEFARQRGWVIIETIRDTASGYSLDRPGMERIRRLMRDGLIDVILVFAVDRLARNQTKLAVLLDEAQEHEVMLECVTEKLEDTAVGRFIMSARAFAAVIKREKISERTMRGKLERAKAGKLPQAFGKDCYGYVYNRETAKREIEPLQADVVRRSFRRYAESRGFHSVARELNADGIPTFANSLWHPATIRQTLRNESYTGRLVYRRTKSVMSRGLDGKRRRRYVERPSEEWVEIDDASPRIIDDALWGRIQAIFDDPGRIARNCTARYAYPLRGRVRCIECGPAW